MGKTESEVQNDARLGASNSGSILWRNNVGAVHTADGRFLRFGLANDSAAVCAKTKSSDLIGIRPVVITAGHVGTTIGQFYAREVKRGGWTYRGTPREAAQFNFIQIVNSFGGDARFYNGEGPL